MSILNDKLYNRANREAIRLLREVPSYAKISKCDDPDKLTTVLLLSKPIRDYVSFKYVDKILQRELAVELLENAAELLYEKIPNRIERIVNHYTDNGTFDNLPVREEHMLRLILWLHHEQGTSARTAFGYMAAAMETAYGHRVSLTEAGKLLWRLHNRGLIQLHKGLPGGPGSTCELVIPEGVDVFTTPPALGEGSSATGQDVMGDHWSTWCGSLDLSALVMTLQSYSRDSIRVKFPVDTTKWIPEKWMETLLQAR